MGTSQLLVLLGVAAVMLGGAALLRPSGVPTPVFFVVAGLGLGFLPDAPHLHLNPDVVLYGLLPPLLFQAGWASSPRAFFSRAVPIGLLAIGLVVATAAVVAITAHHLGHLSWPMSFVLGTALGPTDAVAVTSIAARVGLPRDLIVVAQGEALFNDGTALVLFSSAVAAATSGQVSAAHVTGSVLAGSAVGIAMGLAVGVAGRLIGRLLDDPEIEVVATLLAAYVAYVPAAVIGASGVLAAATAGLYLGWHSSPIMSARTRLQATAFNNVVVFLIEGVLFILIGLEFHTFRTSSLHADGRLVLTAAAVVGAVIGCRMAWMLLWRVGGLLRRTTSRQGLRRELVLLGWAGMRGALTLAAVLAVPVRSDRGAPLPGRTQVIEIAYAVILVTLLLPGLTLEPLARWLGLTRPSAMPAAEREARLRLARAVLERLDGLDEDGPVSAEAVDALRAVYSARLRRLHGASEEADADMATGLAEEQQLRREVIRLQRGLLLRLRAERRIGAEAARSIERDLDLEETRLH